MKKFQYILFIFFILISLSSCIESNNIVTGIRDNGSKKIVDFEPRKYTSHFGIDNEGFYYQDFDMNIKHYYPSFNTEDIQILNENFFLYNESLYSDYKILGGLYDSSIHLVSDTIEINELKLLGNNYLYDKNYIYTAYGSGSAYPSFVQIGDGSFDIDNHMLIKENKMHCFNEDEYFRINLEDWKIKNERNIYLLKQEHLGSEYSVLYIGCKRFNPVIVSKTNSPFGNSINSSETTLRDLDVSDIEIISKSYIKIGDEIYVDDSYLLHILLRGFGSINKETFQPIVGDFSKDRNNVYYFSKVLGGLDPKNIRIISNNILTDGKKSYYKFWKINYPDKGVQELGKYYFSNNNFIYPMTLGQNFIPGKELNIDYNSHQVLGGSLIKDKDVVYYMGEKINLNPDKLKLFYWGYYGDDKSIFFGGTKLEGVDASQFHSFRFAKQIARDNKSIYHGAKKIDSINVDSFEVLNYYFGKDNNNLYFLDGGVELIVGIDRAKELEVTSNKSIKYNGSIYVGGNGRHLTKDGEYFSTTSIH